MATTIKPRSRVISIRDTYSPRASRRNGLATYSACARDSSQKSSRRLSNAGTACGTAEETNEMAFTCKVQFLDDTDPFASTNFPEPTRPPSCTLYANIPLCEQIAVIHKLLKPPHNVSEVMPWKFCRYCISMTRRYCLPFSFGHLCRSWWPDNGFFFLIIVRRCGVTNSAKWNVFGFGKYVRRASRRFGWLS